MKYDDSSTSFLSAKTFSNAAIIRLESLKGGILYRDEYLLKTCRNKKIIHIGFVDHIPLIDEKIKKGLWLHQNLVDVTKQCYGIDVNKDGIDYIRDKHNYTSLYALDIIHDDIPKEILDIDFDYILIPDVIEHIGNPVHFLNAIREKFENNVDKIILTTPNAFRLQNSLNALKGVEVLNSDHRFWFTPYTLSKILTDAKYRIDRLNYFEHRKISNKYFIRKFLISKFHALRDTLIVESTLRKSTAIYNSTQK